MLKDLYINVLIKEPNKNPIKKRIRNEVERITTLLKGRFDGVRIDIWTHLIRECIINYVH